MSIKPVGNKIIVFPLEKKEEKLGGIVIPGTANADLMEGEVLEVSDEISNKCKIGDVVLYPSKCGVGTVFNGKPSLWLRYTEDEIWGIIKKV